MEKKDIYEHLAKIYLDSTPLKKKKYKSRPIDLKNLILISVAVILATFILINTFSYKHRIAITQAALVLSSDTIKINYRFDPAKKEIYSWDLDKLNLSNYKALGFSLKKSNYSDIISLRVEFTNIYKEKSEIYLKDIPNKWQDFKISLADFKNISDWSEMDNLAFIVEEWNTQDNKGIIYIDNVKFVR
jgi:hypothetical protein